MSNRINDVDNLFVYTKTNIDEKFARYTNTRDLSATYALKTEVGALSSATDEKIIDLSGEFQQKLVDMHDANAYHYDGITPLSTWVEGKIQAATTAAIVFKGIAPNAELLDGMEWQGTLYMDNDRPKVGHMWLVPDSTSSVYNEYIYREGSNPDHPVPELVRKLDE